MGKVSLLKMATDGVWEACLERERQGKISIARFNEGMHMNYLGIGARGDASGRTEPHQEDSQLGNMRDNGGYAAGDDELCQGVDKEGDMPDRTGSFLISPSTYSAELLVTDDDQSPLITMTAIRDVGRFVAAALNLKEWQHDMNIKGDTQRLDQILAMLEATRSSKYKVVKLSSQQIQDQINALCMPQEMMKGLWLELKLMLTRNADGEGFLRGNVNTMCPEIEATRIQEYIEWAWEY